MRKARASLRLRAAGWGPRRCVDAVAPRRARAATVRLSCAIDAPYLFEISRWFVFVALVAWAFAFVGMIVRIAGSRVLAR